MNPLSVECVGVIGLGYVGLSLATAFGRVLPTVGFDIDHHHIFSAVSLALLAARTGFNVQVIERLHEPSTKYTLRGFLIP